MRARLAPMVWRPSRAPSCSGIFIRACSSSGKPPPATEAAHKEKAARELVYGEGGQPPKMPYATMAFTAFVLGSYVAYVKLIEEPADARALLAQPQIVEDPLPPGAMK